MKMKQKYITFLKNLQGIKKTDIELFANISAYFLTQVKLTEQEKKTIND